MESSTPHLQEHYKTIVIGAGPAGILAAHHAAQAGSVLLAEANRLPRCKSCGGMLHEDTRRMLSEYAPIPERIILKPATVLFRFHDWDRDIYKITDLKLLNVDRALFDDWLLSILPPEVEVASECKVRSLTETPSHVEAIFRTSTGNARITCDYLVGADGSRSSVRRSIGTMDTEQYVTLQDHVRIDGPIESYFDCVYMRHISKDYVYTYVVPKGETALVGSVFYPHSKRPWIAQDQIMKDLRKRMPELGPTLEREASTALYVRTIDDVVPGRGRILLAGEAGGFLSPTSGEGISYAINSGRAAGMAVAAAQGANALSLYRNATATLRSTIARKFRWLPVVESEAGKYLAGYVPAPVVSRITHGL